ncbi:glycosyltransferase family 2 protein [Mangrovimonas sp. YM274]|uniref:glycosyltransferase family 2 protein n=1 Tax=Mangrovimonas sp. YM274 TaxID=3070660 RepID=UPI0027DC15A4|nr:glycosyltransferase family 2 protein [Mangrovimonas sp. YM274]WMI68458.1 glycosyltransferase family 2 protein [Mangrovimonas sp. YM274]
MKRNSEVGLISIVIPAYNREKLISQTLDSILEQSFQNWECLVVDDGSTDFTNSIVKSYIEKDGRFRLLERDRLPKGAPTCRNIGLENAKGKYIIFLDSDDILFSHALESRVDFMESKPKLDFCVTPGLRGEYPISNQKDYYLISSKNDKENTIEEFFRARIPWNTLNPTYKKQSILEHGLVWDENLEGFQDIDFHVNCLISNLSFEYSNNRLEPDCLWRFHSLGNIGNDIKGDVRKVRLWLYILEKYGGNPECPKETLKPLIASIIKNYIFNKKLKDNNVIRSIQECIYKLDLGLMPLTMYYCTLYRYFYQKNIRYFPSLFRFMIAKSKDNYILLSSKNNHYKTYRYVLNN